MDSKKGLFDEHKSLHKLQHYLPAQAALKDFVHHNTLHAFQHLTFFEGINKASQTFGFQVTLSLDEYRSMYQSKRILEDILEKSITDKKGESAINAWKEILLHKNYETQITSRVGQLRANWKDQYGINLDKITSPFLFRFLASYLDQGIAIRNFPIPNKSFLSAVREIEQNSIVSFFKTPRAKKLLLDEKQTLENLLHLVVGDETYFEQYLFDQQFAHPGLSGFIGVVEIQPETLLDRRIISLHDFIFFELLLEIDALDEKFGETWKPLALNLSEIPAKLFDTIHETELFEVLTIWQNAFEWSYYDDVLCGIKSIKQVDKQLPKSFQAAFCIDDREYSLRRYVENIDPKSETFGTPGFFGVEFYFQPENGKFLTKACPAPVTPKFLIKEGNRKKGIKTDVHYNKRAHAPIQGWLISQTLGFSSAFKLFFNIFKPSVTPATALSFQHMDKHSQLTIENENETFDGLQVGFTIEEMALRVGNTLKSIGLVKDFSPIVYLVGHGASSVNNTHYAGYDCGACCGRPGAVNARVFSFMANHKKVREILNSEGIAIPEATQFIGSMHDTTRDEIEFYDEDLLSANNATLHLENVKKFLHALDLNAKERSRRFETIDTKMSLKKVHERVKRRSVSLFEPRPELNHATNAMCIVGRGSLTKGIFLDRRPFMNSYDYRVDQEGKYLLNILNAAAPVCGGINLEYYFSRVDTEKLGAGTKLPHNVIGLYAVSNGVDGDLRPGLPAQMIEVHDPIRLLFIIEHLPEVVLKTIQTNKSTYEWFINEWVHLVVKNPEDNNLYLFKEGKFINYQPLKSELPVVSNIETYIETYQENIPVLLTN